MSSMTYAVVRGMGTGTLVAGSRRDFKTHSYASILVAGACWLCRKTPMSTVWTPVRKAR